jgi:hypothetical protein
MFIKRGSRPKKTDDGWCGRRIKKAARQAGSPDQLDICPIHSADVANEVARLSYDLRKRRVPKRAFKSLAKVRRYLCRLVKRIAPPAPAPAVRIGGATKPTKLKPSVYPGLGHSDRAPVDFIPESKPYDLEPRPLIPPKRPVAPRIDPFRFGWVKNLNLDKRVFDTNVELPVSKAIRRARRKGRTACGAEQPYDEVVRAIPELLEIRDEIRHPDGWVAPYHGPAADMLSANVSRVVAACEEDDIVILPLIGPVRRRDLKPGDLLGVPGYQVPHVAESFKSDPSFAAAVIGKPMVLDSDDYSD